MWAKIDVETGELTVQSRDAVTGQHFLVEAFRDYALEIDSQTTDRAVRAGATSILSEGGYTPVGRWRVDAEGSDVRTVTR